MKMVSSNTAKVSCSHTCFVSKLEEVWTTAYRGTRSQVQKRKREKEKEQAKTAYGPKEPYKKKQREINKEMKNYIN